MGEGSIMYEKLAQEIQKAWAEEGQFH